jgi:hypothetical protein
VISLVSWESVSFVKRKFLDKGVIIMKAKMLLVLPLLIIVLSIPVFAQDKVDEKATQLIKDYTTDPKFLTPMVDYLPASDTVPSQLQVLGYIAGTPGKLTYYDDIVRYFRALDEKSDRIAVFEMGETDRGVMQIMALVSDAETIANLSRYQEFTKELADPRTCDEARMKQIVGEAKPFYFVSGGLHSPEMGAPEMLMELAYRLAVSETEQVKRIRANVITVIIPVFEVDGWNRQVGWYYRHTKKIENWDDMVRGSSPYWGDYVHHDNNRDGIMVSQRLTKNFFNAFFNFHPQVCLDLHESVPLLYVSTGTGPYYTSLDPLIINEWQWFAFNEVTQLTRYGVPGVWTHGFYTGWYPGYMLWLPNNHNAIGRFYETFGNAGANTFERNVSFGRRGAMTTEWYRPVPPPKKVTWSYRNNINLQQSGVLASLDFTARNRDTILENFWIKGRNAVEAGKNSAPYAWIIPLEQKDPLAARRLLGVLPAQRIELHKLEEDFKLGEKTYPAGSVVVRLDQPYRTIAKTLLEEQVWPKDSQNNPYDATAWTLGLMLGVETCRIDDKSILDAPMAPLDGQALEIAARIDGKRQSEYLLLPPQGTAMMAAYLRLREKGVTVRVADAEFKHGEIILPAGTWVLPGFKVNDETGKGRQVLEVCWELGLRAYAYSNVNLPALRELDLPRLAMYHSWINTQESGWTRFALEKEGIPFTLINDEKVRQGDLLSDFDVIIIPHQGGWGGGARLLRGIDDRFGPVAYTQTEEFKYHGYPDSSEDISGGLGLEGLAAIEKFVHDGGTLITLGTGSSLVTDFGLVRGIFSQNVPNLACPGTILAGTVKQPNNPIAYGYDEHPSIYRSSMPLVSVEKRMQKYVVLQFGTKSPEDEEEEDYTLAYGVLQEEKKPATEEKPQGEKVKLLRGGLLRGGEVLDGTAAVIDAPLGKGRVVLFAFNPMYRWMNQVDFSFVYNAILDWKAPAALREAPEKSGEEKAEAQ